MSTKRQVTLRSQWIGKTFRELRQHNGMTLQEVGEYLTRDISSLSRFESGIHPPRRADVISLMDLYGVEEESQRTTILRMVDEVSKTGWWEQHSKDLSKSVIDAVWLEDRAKQLQIFSITAISGLLQTPAYAEALIRVMTPQAPKQQLKRWVDLRLKRQEILERREELQLSVVLDEAALRRPIGGTETMSKQLQLLATRAHESNVALRVLPFGAGEHCGASGPYTIIHMPDPFPILAHVETPAGILYAEAGEAEELATRYDRLWTSSLSEHDSVSFISALEQEWS